MVSKILGFRGPIASNSLLVATAQGLGWHPRATRGEPSGHTRGEPSAHLPVNFRFPLVCQERSAESTANVDGSAPPSVAQLAGRFREQAAAAKEVSQAASEPLFWEGAGGRGSLGQARRRGREEAR